MQQVKLSENLPVFNTPAFSTPALSPVNLAISTIKSAAAAGIAAGLSIDQIESAVAIGAGYTRISPVAPVVRVAPVAPAVYISPLSISKKTTHCSTNPSSGWNNSDISTDDKCTCPSTMKSYDDSIKPVEKRKRIIAGTTLYKCNLA